MSNDNMIMRWAEPSPPDDSNAKAGGAPTIKNHSVTYHDGLLYCFGGYDGRRNHQTLLIYSLNERRWRRVEHQAPSSAASPSAAAAAAAAAAMTGGRTSGGGAAAAAAGVGGGGGNVGAGGIRGTNIPDAEAERIIGLEVALDPGRRNAGNGGSVRPGRLFVSGTPPPGRNGHTATLATSPSGDNARIVIIGGWLGTGPLAASDMHVLDISGGVEGLRWYQPTVRGTPPGPCNMHSADYIPKKNEIYLFRGGNGREYLNDLHALDCDTYTWRQVQTRGEAPQQRANHSSAVLEETNELFIFGGWNGRERLNDIHILDTETGVWTRPRIGGELPYPRAGMTLTALRGRLFLFGGSGTSSKCFNDLQILDRKEMAWLNVTQIKNSSVTSGGAASQHSQHGDSSQSGQTDGDSNEHAPSDWRVQDIGAQRAATLASAASQSGNPNDEAGVATIFVQGNGPGRRAGHTATAVDRQIFVFGGSCGSDYLNDFFVLDTDPIPYIEIAEPTSIQLCERRLRHFYNDEEFSDVTFIVEGREIYGHKLILSLVSDCFQAMFTTKHGGGTGGFRESSSDCTEIEIPNCTYDAFLTMIEYIYTGQTPKVDVVVASTGAADGHAIERVVNLLEVADLYFLEHLKQLCERMLKPAITPETVEYFLQISQKTNAKQLEAVCLHLERNSDSM